MNVVLNLRGGLARPWLRRKSDQQFSLKRLYAVAIGNFARAVPGRTVRFKR